MHSFSKRWCRKGPLVKLRNEYYASPEYKQAPDFARYVANCIYAPSYIRYYNLPQIVRDVL